RRPGRGKWPIAWLVHHICDAEIALAFRIRLALAQSGTRFQAYDQDLWAAGLHYDRRSVADSVALYTAMRKSHLELLRLGSGKELRRYGIHEERGKESVERLMHMLAGHDLNHLRQIRAIRAQLSRR
ncbi:MAG TPA: DinB family protein, partial [Bacteroidota bacterium]|nr:DinB family protein [Bacteroidota bacterium]